MGRKKKSVCFEPFEAELRADGFHGVAGVDEVGRGCLAGSVVAAAVILPASFSLVGINDSKKMSAAGREEAADRILRKALAVFVAEASVEEIATLNILWASLLAMKRAIAGLAVPADYVLVDGNRPVDGVDVPQLTVVKGDSRSASIAAASIVAKVARDRQMVALDAQFPGYGFAENKGYGTQQHRDAIRLKGPTLHHRRTFSGVAEYWQVSSERTSPSAAPEEAPADVGQLAFMFGSSGGSAQK